MIDLHSFARNVRLCWQRRVSFAKFLQHLSWIYSHRLWKGREWVIGIRYLPPLGIVRIRVRGNSGADYFIFSEIFEHQCYRFPISSPSTILDLGANIGMASIYFSRQYPQAQIACVEPIGDNLRLLRNNLAMNDVKAYIFSAAIDVADGKAVMELGDKDYAHRISEQHRITPVGSTLVVSALSVGTILDRLRWDRVGLLKVDIEGHEKTLFAKNCDWLHRIDAMCIECHNDFGEADIRSLAARYGFDQPSLHQGIWLVHRTRVPSSGG